MFLHLLFVFVFVCRIHMSLQEFLQPFEVVGRHKSVNGSVLFDYSHVNINYGPLEAYDCVLKAKIHMKQNSQCSELYTAGCDRVNVQLFEIIDNSMHLLSETTIQMFENQEIYTVTLNAFGSNKKHLRLTKITEALVGSILYSGLEIESEDGSKVEIAKDQHPSVKEKRRIEVYGDSLTCGYGILGKMPCGFTPQTEDCTKTYAALTAQHFEADLQTVCVSGIGLLHCYGSETVISPVNQYKILNQSLASDPSSQWNFEAFKPHLVIIYLGANDYSTLPHPTGEMFIEYYVKYLENIWTRYGREAFPQKYLLLCGFRTMENPWCQYVSQVAEIWNQGSGRPQAHVINVSQIQTPDLDGCDDHPDTVANQLIYEKIYPQIQQFMEW